MCQCVSNFIVQVKGYLKGTRVKNTYWPGKFKSTLRSTLSQTVLVQQGFEIGTLMAEIVVDLDELLVQQMKQHSETVA